MTRASALAGALAVAMIACVDTGAASAQTAQLALQQVFGTAPASLTVGFGTVDALCIGQPVTGVTCSSDGGAVTATWYGTVSFRAVLSGLGSHTVRLTGVRATAGTLPSGLLLDGASGVPSTAYPVSPTSPITLATAIPNGTTTVTRSFGVKVRAADRAGAWSTPVVYSLIVE